MAISQSDPLVQLMNDPRRGRVGVVDEIRKEFNTTTAWTLDNLPAFPSSPAVRYLIRR